jgi:hypothetical protein
VGKLLGLAERLYENIGSDTGFWIAVAAVVASGPSYVRVLLGFRNKKRQILGDLNRKSRKLDNDIAAKEAKRARRAEKDKS